MNLKRTLLPTLLLLSLSLFLNAAPPVEEGKSIFQARCAACHNINKTMTGPALAGVDQRRSLDWIINFVHSSQTVIKNGDKDAVALFKQFNNIPMPDHRDLSGSQIASIVEYIKAEASAAEKEGNAQHSVQKQNASFPITVANYGYLLSFFAVISLLIGAIILAIRVNIYKRNYFRQKQ